MTYINCIIKDYNKIYRVIVFYVIIRTFKLVTVLGFRLKKSAFLTVDVFFNISITLLSPLYFSHFSSPSVFFYFLFSYLFLLLFFLFCRLTSFFFQFYPQPFFTPFFVVIFFPFAFTQSTNMWNANLRRMPCINFPW